MRAARRYGTWTEEPIPLDMEATKKTVRFSWKKKIDSLIFAPLCRKTKKNHSDIPACHRLCLRHCRLRKSFMLSRLCRISDNRYIHAFFWMPRLPRTSHFSHWVSRYDWIFYGNGLRCFQNEHPYRRYHTLPSSHLLPNQNF